MSKLSEVAGQLHIERRERLYVKTLTITMVFGHYRPTTYTKRYWRVRWHIVDATGKCQAPGVCGDKGQAACGWTYRREARRRFHELTGRWR